jgi:hypothetical protein
MQGYGSPGLAHQPGEEADGHDGVNTPDRLQKEPARQTCRADQPGARADAAYAQSRPRTIRPTALQKRCISLTAGPTAPGIARGQVRVTIAAWDIPVDTSVAILLTSELVTNAVMHEAGETINLVITCGYGQLGVDVHDTLCELPVPVDGPPDAETGRGLVLVAGLSSSWGYYRTPTGKAVYFTLAFADDSGEDNTREE